MNVSLTPELEKLVQEKVASGLYQTASEVVREGLRLLKERDDRQTSLREAIREGLTQLETGKYQEYTADTLADLAQAVKDRGRQRLAERQKSYFYNLGFIMPHADEAQGAQLQEISPYFSRLQLFG